MAVASLQREPTPEYPAIKPGMMGMYIFLASEVMFFGSLFAMYFYMVGSHVLGGLVLLTLILYRAARGQFSSRNHVGPAAVTLYWHFVDVVWIFLFGILYLGVTAFK